MSKPSNKEPETIAMIMIVIMKMIETVFPKTERMYGNFAYIVLGCSGKHHNRQPIFGFNATKNSTDWTYNQKYCKTILEKFAEQANVLKKWEDSAKIDKIIAKVQKLLSSTHKSKKYILDEKKGTKSRDYSFFKNILHGKMSEKDYDNLSEMLSNICELHSWHAKLMELIPDTQRFGDVLNRWIKKNSVKATPEFECSEINFMKFMNSEFSGKKFTL